MDGTRSSLVDLAKFSFGSLVIVSFVVSPGSCYFVLGDVSFGNYVYGEDNLGFTFLHGGSTTRFYATRGVRWWVG